MPNTSKFKYTFVSPCFLPKSYLIINTVLHFALSCNNISWRSLIQQLKPIRIQANPELPPIALPGTMECRERWGLSKIRLDKNAMFMAK